MKHKLLFIALSLFILLSTTMLNAKTFRYGQVKKMPLSVEKDYYIWRFLSQKSTTVSQAKAIIGDAKYINKKLRTAYKKKTGLNAKQTKRKPGPQRNITDWKAKSNANKSFKYGIKMVEKNKLGKAAQHFNAAYRQYEQRWEKDKSLFWLYKVTKNKSYLSKLKKSYHINMYTLLAADLTKGQYPKSIITPSINKNSACRSFENFLICLL